MNTDREEAIKARAYQLWEESGHAHGRHLEHWRQAELEIDGVAPDVDRPTSITAMSERHGGEVNTPHTGLGSPQPLHTVPERIGGQ